MDIHPDWVRCVRRYVGDLVCALILPVSVEYLAVFPCTGVCVYMFIFCSTERLFTLHLSQLLMVQQEQAPSQVCARVCSSVPCTTLYTLLSCPTTTILLLYYPVHPTTLPYYYYTTTVLPCTPYYPALLLLY